MFAVIAAVIARFIAPLFPVKAGIEYYNLQTDCRRIDMNGDEPAASYVPIHHESIVK